MEVKRGLRIEMRRKNAKPEKLIQDTIEFWLSLQRGLVVMPIDNISRYNPTTKMFRPKKQNRGSVFYKGIPDIIVYSSVHGFVGLEVKSEVGRLSPEQKSIQEAIKGLGGHYLVVRSLDDVMKFFGAPKGLEPIPLKQE